MPLSWWLKRHSSRCRSSWPLPMQFQIKTEHNSKVPTCMPVHESCVDHTHQHEDERMQELKKKTAINDKKCLCNAKCKKCKKRKHWDGSVFLAIAYTCTQFHLWRRHWSYERNTSGTLSERIWRHPPQVSGERASAQCSPLCAHMYMQTDHVITSSYILTWRGGKFTVYSTQLSTIVYNSMF